MGDVLVVYRVMPESPEVPLERLRGDIEKVLGPVAKRVSTEEEPIGFGLVALKVSVVMPDQGDVSGQVEESLRSIEGVSSAETIEVGLL